MKSAILRAALGMLLTAAVSMASAATPAKYTMRVGVPGLTPVPVAAPPVDPVDPYFANVKLLLHLNSPSLTDTKGSAITSYGVNSFTTVQKLFGSGSVTFAGNGRALMAPPFQPKGDYTVEGWVYAVPVSNAWTFLDIGGIANVNWQSQSIYLDTDGKLHWWASSANNGTDISGGVSCASPCSASAVLGPVNTNAWNHFAVVHSGTQYYMYVNGVRTNTISSTKNPYSSNSAIVIGNYPYNTQTGISGGFPGYLTELRLTDGVARYTGATYTVPTAAFPDK